MTNLRLLTIGGADQLPGALRLAQPVQLRDHDPHPSLTQLAFFVYLGRTAHVADDAYYVAGNALVAAAAPSLFGMAQTVAGERYTHTLYLLVVSPASRIAVFFGRSLPATVNGIVVSIWTLAIAASCSASMYPRTRSRRSRYDRRDGIRVRRDRLFKRRSAFAGARQR